jgi:hypothetical protein
MKNDLPPAFMETLLNLQKDFILCRQTVGFGLTGQ